MADGRVEEDSYVTGRAGFPYIPGYFAYREVWALFHAVQGLRKRPDVVLCDGNGRLHQRRCGVACYLGILLAAPVIFVSKNPPRGVNVERLAVERGSWVDLQGYGIGEGVALRTQSEIKPICVSVGNMISNDGIIDVTLAQCFYGCLSLLERLI